MNFLEAAYEILKLAGQPLHYAEITQRALQKGILDTKGQTPEATMGSRLYVDTKRPESSLNGWMIAFSCFQTINRKRSANKSQNSTSKHETNSTRAYSKWPLIDSKRS